MEGAIYGGVCSEYYLRTPLQFFPRLSTDVGLAQYPAEQFSANVSLMRIRYPDGYVPADHELMPPTGIRSGKSHEPQIANQVLSLDWLELRHYATSLMVNSMPSITGKGRCWWMRKKTHSSSTSANCSRQSSSVVALAYTPLHSGISP